MIKPLYKKGQTVETLSGLHGIVEAIKKYVNTRDPKKVKYEYILSCTDFNGKMPVKENEIKCGME
jgi:preprotein translocase subunit YajC